ncbi:glutathione degradosome [Parathielavia appendiculata]|uniref:Glutathione degradosome n=1 Tax=Parathielavia appendiculata TaxID=2587402 RepID=A0AAN6U7R0_9PEZI|nr:glutathione degradosome [Parathielavia appendiculata]
MTGLQPRELDEGSSDSGHDPTPDKLQELRHDGSVLAIAVSDQYIFAGTSKGEIVLWSLGTYQHVQTIQAHKRSVLCLLLSEDSKYLFSSACEPIIGVWCPKTFTRLYEIYSTYDVGDVFSVAYSPQRETLYLGTQTQDIQWVSLKDPTRRVSHDSANHPDKRQHRFFDSRAVGGTSTPRRTEEHYALIPKAATVLEIDPGAIRQYAHYGWVFCMLVAKGPTVLGDPDEEVLISGGGDGTIKLWRLSDDGPDYDDGVLGDIEEMMTLGEDDSESVMSLAVDGSFLYAGKLQGIIELWDLDTKQKLRVIKAHDGNVNTLRMSFGLLWSAATGGSASKHSTVHYGRDKNGLSQNVSQKYQCLSRWKAHGAKILSSAVAVHQNERLYLTGANDNTVRVWRVSGMPTQAEQEVGGSENMMIASLREFVSFKTISSRPEFTEDCRKGATYLGSLFKRLGAQVEMLSTGGPHNPVVYAKFSGKLEPAEKRKRILFYGHYDVVPADMKGNNWQTDPFKLEGRDGYLYGRGVSDNKGPIIAALYAVSDLLQAKVLDSDILFLIEGEEESGSRGFQDTIRMHKDLVGHVDYVLLANSYWLDDEVPCLTYGLRGVLHATVCIDSKYPDLHSGVDGSNMLSEPLTDLTLLLAKLKDAQNHVKIPGFYDGILPLTHEEDQRYDDIARILIRRNPANGPIEHLKRSLMARWREPNLTIHRYNVSGPDGSLISSHATANVSVRLVPGQEVEQVIDALKKYLRDEYEKFGSENTLTVRIDNKAEPWLGVPGNYIFRTLEEAVVRAWAPAAAGDSATAAAAQDGEEAGVSGVAMPANATDGEEKPKCRKPLYIREGGSIPPIRFLEKEFNAPAAHLPCGQASDAAHLDNERLRVVNLMKSREIFRTVFRNL